VVKVKTIPFSLMPTPIVKAIAKKIKGVGRIIAEFFPNLEDELTQSEYDYDSREYATIAIVSSTFNASFIFFLLLIVGNLAKADTLVLSVSLAIVMFIASFSTILYYPQLISTRKMRRIENNLIPATRQLYIEVKSGVPLFNAMISISTKYGDVSYEFKKIVSRINAGVSELDAISEASKESPSFRLRKILWQISNALKVGSDVGNALEITIDNLTKEKIDDIEKYAHELSPWTMMYMMIAVIVPSLGITILIVVISIVNIPITSIIFPVILILLAAFQLVFLNLIKTRRPQV
jgi:flagellar protein FlaJ